MLEAREKKLRANRENAQKSTGPRSPNGKAISARNRLSHGMRAERFLLQDERVKDWNLHKASVHACLDPQNYLEAEIADAVCLALWRLHRAARSELGLTIQRQWGAQKMQEAGMLDLGAEQVRLPLEVDLLARYERSAQGMLIRGIALLRELKMLGSFGRIGDKDMSD